MKTIVSVLLCLGTAFAQKPEVTGRPEIIEHRMNPHHEAPAPTAGGIGSLSPIINHGGPVMNGTVNVYLIWYGNWNQSTGSDTPTGKGLVTTFIGGIGSTSHYAINFTYGAQISNSVILAGQYNDAGSLGTRLSDANIKTIVTNSIGPGKLPSDTNGVYFVLTSSDVTARSGFCTRYCGWHTHGTIGGQNLKYSFVGNANRCLSSCAPQLVSPNSNPGVDGMISVIMHELEETVTDPDLNAWYDAGGAENADKCAWTFGSGQTQLPSGAFYNMTVGGLNYLIQRNLKASDNKCYVTSAGQQ